MATISWAVEASGDWHTRSDWSGGTLPGAGDAVLLDTRGNWTVGHSTGSDTIASLTAGTDLLDVTGGLLRVSGTASLQAGLDLAGGTLNLAGGATIGGGFTATGGTLSLAAGSVAAVTQSATFGDGVSLTGLGTLSTAGATSIGADGSALLIGAGITWTNSGTATLTGTIESATAAAITNTAGARFVLAGDGAAILVGAGRETFSNLGTLAKTGGSGTSTIEATLMDTGTIAVDAGSILLTATARLGGVLTGSGTLALAGGGNQIAGLAAASGSTVALASGVGTSLSASTLGALQVAGGEVVASGNDTIAGGLVLRGGGVFVSSGVTLTVLGSTVVQGGATLSGGGGLVALGGVASVGADGLATGLVNIAVTETGAVALDAALDSSGNVTLGIAAGATIALDSDAAAILDLAGVSHLSNAGTLAKLAGSGSSRIDSVLTSTGTLDAGSGTLDLDGGGSIGGAVTGDGTLLLGGGNFSILAGTGLHMGALLVSGGSVGVATLLAGALGVSGGRLELQEAGHDAVTALTLGVGTLTLDHGVTLTVSGAASLAGGTLVGSGRLTTTAATSVAALTLGSGLTWANRGTATVTGAVQGGSNDSVTNQVGGVIDLADGAALLMAGTLGNAGTLARTEGGGSATIGLALASMGTLAVASGTLALDGGGSLAGSVTGAGTLLFGGGAFTVASSTAFGVANLAVGGGSVTFGDTAAVAALSADSLQVSGGSLLLAGGATLAVSGAAAVSDAGTLGGAGTLTTSGSATLGADGQAVSLAGGLVWNVGGSVSAEAGIIGAGTGAVTIDVLAGSAFDLAGNAAGIVDGGSIVTLSVAGTFVKTGGGTSTLYGSVGSTGTLLVRAGTLVLPFAATLSGTAGGAGGLLLLESGASSAGTLALADNGAAASVQVSSGFVTWTNDGSVADAGLVRLGDGSGSGPAILYNAPGATWAFAGDDGAIAGDSQALLTNDGLLVKMGGDGLSTVAIGFTNSGVVQAASGTLALLGTIGGSGTLQIEGATLELGQTPVSSQAFVFAGGGGVLALDRPASIAGPMQGFGLGDGIDFSDLGVSAASVAGDVLSVTAGGSDYTFTSSLALGALQPVIAADGHGGSLVTLAAGHSDSPALPIGHGGY